MLDTLTMRPLDLLSRGRKTWLIFTAARKFTSMQSLYAVIGWSSASTGQWKTPALFTKPHRPAGTHETNVLLVRSGAHDPTTQNSSRDRREEIADVYFMCHRSNEKISSVLHGHLRLRRLRKDMQGFKMKCFQWLQDDQLVMVRRQKVSLMFIKDQRWHGSTASWNFKLL